MQAIFFLVVVLLATFSPAVLAHSGISSSSGFVDGFMHPIWGLDHVIAMVAVGLWGAFLGKPLVWQLPIVFPLMMAFSGALGVAGISLPYVEIGIATSGIILGTLVALKIRLPNLIAVCVVALFAVFHGYAHGVELPQAANPFAFSMGFVISTGLLHLAGILFGELTRWSAGTQIVRLCGVFISVLGAFFLFGALQ